MIPLRSIPRRLRTLLCASILVAAPVAARANATFVFTPDPGTSQQAIDAFTQAGQIWSTYLADDITIRLQIGFSPLAFGVVGETTPVYYALEAPTYDDLRTALAADATSADDFSAVAHLQLGSSYSRLINHTSDNPNGANSAVPYVDSMNWVGLTLANAKALGFVDPHVGLDGRIVFSSLFAFDFTHDSIDPGSFDFVGAAVHEIGHVLGFISGVDDIDILNGSDPGTGFSSNMIDLFRFSAESIAAGPGIQDYTADTREKYFSVDGGATAIASFSTGVNYGDGRQASHWKDNQGLGIMDPTADTGEQLNISSTDLRAMDVIGYTIVPEPSAALLLGLGAIWIGFGTRCRARKAA